MLLVLSVAAIQSSFVILFEYVSTVFFLYVRFKSLDSPILSLFGFIITREQ